MRIEDIERTDRDHERDESARRPETETERHE